MAFRVDTFGPAALMVRHADRADEAGFLRAQALMEHLERHPLPGLLEVTPGVTTLLLEFQRGSRPDPALVRETLERVAHSARRVLSSRGIVEVPVVYDGPDLERVASLTGLSVAEVIRRHAAAEYRVQILGFSPGFPYLVGLDPQLVCARLDQPRPRVPAGSVAIAAEYSSIYPVATAGGWNLIGRTDLPLVDLDLARSADSAAFRFRPGDVVRFIEVTPGGAP